MSILPPQFDENNTIFVTKHVSIKWVQKYKLHYESLGYVYTGERQPFVVSVNDLREQSNVEVNVKCPHCNRVRTTKFQVVSKAGHTICKSCVTSLRCFDDLTGQRFERLFVQEYHHTNGRGQSYWLCQCDCGNEHVTSRKGLISGDTRSCGCLMRESSSRTTRNRIGRKHPMYGLRGKLSPFYDHTKTQSERVTGRHIDGYVEWRTSVYEQFSYTCFMCGDNRGGNLNAHHLFSWKEYPQLRLSVDNGVCLCDECHREFHASYGYGKNTANQFLDFIESNDRTSDRETTPARD